MKWDIFNKEDIDRITIVVFGLMCSVFVPNIEI